MVLLVASFDSGSENSNWMELRMHPPYKKKKQKHEHVMLHMFYFILFSLAIGVVRAERSSNDIAAVATFCPSIMA